MSKWPETRTETEDILDMLAAATETAAARRVGVRATTALAEAAATNSEKAAQDVTRVSCYHRVSATCTTNEWSDVSRSATRTCAAKQAPVL